MRVMNSEVIDRFQAPVFLKKYLCYLHQNIEWDHTVCNMSAKGSSKLKIPVSVILYCDHQMHNYFTNYHTPTCFDTVVSSSGSS